jgi:predicted membrane-bound dolichyl-phosphate-mannose-protein mannosyltransferase
MPKVLAFLCYLVAFLSFLAAAFVGERWPRVNLLALGLAAWVLVPLVNAADSL